MPAVAMLLVGPLLLDRSKVMTQTDRDTPVLQSRELGMQLATTHCKIYIVERLRRIIPAM